MASDFATNPSTTTTYNDTVYSAIIADMVLDALMAHVVTPPLLRKFDLSNQPSKSVDVPKADSFTAAALTEGTEVANTALTTSKVTGTAAEIGIMATITDVLEVSDIAAAHGARLKQLGRSIADKVDVDICALLDNFTSTVGTTTVDLTLANILSAIYTLEAANAPKPFVGVLHPVQISDMRTALETNANSPFQSQGIQAGTNEIVITLTIPRKNSLISAITEGQPGWNSPDLIGTAAGVSVGLFGPAELVELVPLTVGE